ncbi:MAG: hypothetical protein ACHQLA_03390 [Ignavibacteriales bacterium]
MKKLAIIFLIFCFNFLTGFSQDFNDKSQSSHWNINPALYFYFIPDDFFMLPIVRADKDVLHLEARYNYEDRKTISAWIGYNFQTVEELEFTATPMIALVLGRTNGIAPGLELDFIFKNFELYSEAEFVLNFEDGHSNYFYNWSELTYSPTEWLWLGIVGQRTRAYQTELEIQRGLMLGTAYKNFEFTFYLFNIGYDDTFAVISTVANF